MGAENATMDPAQDLTFDIWSMVCSKLYFTGPKHDLANICRVSKLLHGAALPFLYRSIDLDFSWTEKPWTAICLEVLTNRKPEYLQYVLSVSARIDDPSPKRLGAEHELVRDMLSHLTKLISRLPFLQRFRWECFETIPKSLILLLNSHPTLQHIHVLFCDWGEGNILASAEIQEQLSGNLKLTSISGRLTHLGNPEPDYQQNRAQLGHLLSHSPSLKAVSLNLTSAAISEGLCLLFAKANKPKRQAQLESLTIESGEFSKFPSEALRFTFNPSSLTKLALKNCVLGAKLMAYMTEVRTCNLKCLEIEVQATDWDNNLGHAHVSKMLRSFTGLEKLSLHNVYLENVVDAVVHHSATLLSFKLDRSEYGQDDYVLPVTTAQFHEILSSCRSLEELHIFVDRVALYREESQTFLEDIRQLPRLRHLKIHTPLIRSISSTELLTPLVEKSFAKSIAESLWSVSLRTLEIICGLDDTRNFWSVLARSRAHWIVQKIEEGEFSVDDWYLKQKADKFKRWGKILGKPLVPPEEISMRDFWEEKLWREVTIAASMAQPRLD